MSASPNRIRPARGRASPEIARMVVVLPAPFAPISDTTAPSGTSRLMPFTASVRP